MLDGKGQGRGGRIQYGICRGWSDAKCPGSVSRKLPRLNSLKSSALDVDYPVNLVQKEQ